VLNVYKKNRKADDRYIIIITIYYYTTFIAINLLNNIIKYEYCIHNKYMVRLDEIKS